MLRLRAEKMTDTASLVARVKTDGADTAARQLDDFAAAAGAADSAASSLGDTAKKQGMKYLAQLILFLTMHL